MQRSVKLICIFILTSVSFSLAQNQMIIQKINNKVILDGLSNEPAWEGIEPVTYVMHRPNFGAEPTERAEVFICYDNENLYVAGRLYDSEPDKIASFSKKRDSGNPNCQWFGIVLDTFNDKENALAFFTTPAGLRWDAAIINDSNGDITYESSWNTFWDVEVVQNEKGWFAEFRIPISSLRFQDIDGKVIMGLITWRMIPRKNEFDIFPEVPPHWGGKSFYKISEAKEIVFEQMYSRKPVYVAPYFLSGFSQNYRLNDIGETYERQDKYEYEAGLDLKYGLMSNLTLDITLNTDFAQVEADDQQINLTRFSLFFPEKRMFFQERASLFDFNFESSEPNRLFYSRRIGIHDDKPVRIYGGTRLVGRIGPWDFGFLNMQTASVDDIASENFGVLRLRRQVFNPYSYIGAISTTRTGTDGKYNIVYGLDGTFHLFGNEYLTVKWAQTFENQNNNNPISFDPARVRIFLQRRNKNGLGYGLGYSYAGKDYNPGVGFETRDNFSRYAWGIWYGWFPDEKSWLFRHQPFLSGVLVKRNTNGTVESAEMSPGWELETKSGYKLSIQTSFLYEDVADSFPISEEVIIPKGNYNFSKLSAVFETPWGKKMSASSEISVGSFYDGKRISFELSPVWNVSSSLELTGTCQLNYLKFQNRNQTFSGHISRLKILYMMDTKFSVSSFFQYNSGIDAVLLNTRLRYNPREGIDLYIVYNETFNTERYVMKPALPLTMDRTLLLKYTHTFSL